MSSLLTNNEIVVANTKLSSSVSYNNVGAMLGYTRSEREVSSRKVSALRRAKFDADLLFVMDRKRPKNK